MKPMQLLNARINELNMLTNSPTEPYTTDEAGSFKAQIGNWHYDSGNGGYMLVRMGTDGGGTTQHSDRMSAPKLAEFLYVLIKGIQIGIKLEFNRQSDKQ